MPNHLTRTFGKGQMTRKETLLLLLSRALANGFEFRRWYQANISSEWHGAEDAVSRLAVDGRHYSFIFSHEFARAFWMKGAQMHFVVPAKTYSRLNGKGQVVTIHRKPFTRRTIKGDVWKDHLRQMAIAEDPLRYLKRFLLVQEELQNRSSKDENLSAAG